jgi:hypothetical protein
MSDIKVIELKDILLESIVSGGVLHVTILVGDGENYPITELGDVFYSNHKWRIHGDTTRQEYFLADAVSKVLENYNKANLEVGHLIKELNALKDSSE